MVHKDVANHSNGTCCSLTLIGTGPVGEMVLFSHGLLRCVRCRRCMVGDLIVMIELSNRDVCVGLGR